MIKIREKIFNKVREVRRIRNSTFEFYPANLKILELLLLYSLEISGQFDKADRYLLKKVLEDLISKNILHKNCLTYSEYKLSKHTYYDVYLKTVENKTYCRGTSTSKITAYAKALGEVFERTSIKYPKTDELHVKKVSEILGNNKYFDLSKVPKPTKLQVEKLKNIEVLVEDEFSFVEVENYFTKVKTFLPAQLVFFGAHSNFIEKSLIQPTTSGAGAGYTSYNAVCSSFFELLHRHHFFAFWFARKSPPRIVNSSLSVNESLYSKITDLEGRNFTVNILDMSESAGVPTVICILEKYGGWYCGGSSGFSHTQTIERAIDEAVSIYLWQVQSTSRGENISLTQCGSIYKDFCDETMTSVNKLHLFANSIFMEKFDKFFIEGRSIEFKDRSVEKKEDTIATLAEKNFGQNLYIYNVERQYLNDCNYHVCKMYIPTAYYFPLDEVYTRSILSNGIVPEFTHINPFP